MPQYEVTTTVSFTCVHIVDADGEETAKEQAEGLALRWIAGTPKHNFPLHVDQEAVQYITRDEDYKLHT
jgi:hypothetical protein